jgi:hypothetical protein
METSYYMSMSLEPLKLTTPPLHRFWFQIHSREQWYSVVNECRNLYGTNWHTQRNVLKRFKKTQNFHRTIQQWMRHNMPHKIWFEVPDLAFATWISVKYSIEVASDLKHSQR